MKFDIDRLQSALPPPQTTWPRADSPGEADGAAVAAVLRQADDGVSALLIRRSTHPMDPWSGHMAFPGGRRHDSDESLLVTAMRETREEVGLDLRQQASLLGALNPVPAIAGGERAGFAITPFVFLLSGAPELVLDSSEVAEALWAPLDPLCRGEGNDRHIHTQKGARHELPAFNIKGRVVWGLTHRMLLGLLQLGSG